MHSAPLISKRVSFSVFPLLFLNFFLEIPFCSHGCETNPHRNFLLINHSFQEDFFKSHSAMSVWIKMERLVLVYSCILTLIKFISSRNEDRCIKSNELCLPGVNKEEKDFLTCVHILYSLSAKPHIDSVLIFLVSRSETHSVNVYCSIFGVILFFRVVKWHIL